MSSKKYVRPASAPPALSKRKLLKQTQRMNQNMFSMKERNRKRVVDQIQSLLKRAHETQSAALLAKLQHTIAELRALLDTNSVATVMERISVVRATQLRARKETAMSRKREKELLCRNARRQMDPRVPHARAWTPAIDVTSALPLRSLNGLGPSTTSKPFDPSGKSLWPVVPGRSTSSGANDPTKNGRTAWQALTCGRPFPAASGRFNRTLVDQEHQRALMLETREKRRENERRRANPARVQQTWHYNGAGDRGFSAPRQNISAFTSRDVGKPSQTGKAQKVPWQRISPCNDYFARCPTLGMDALRTTT